MQQRRVTILGGGNGARAAAFEFGAAGHEVTLYEIPEFADGVRAIAEAGRIRARGVMIGIAPVRVATDIATAVAGADVIIAIVPTMHHQSYAERLAPVLRDGMNVMLMPGSLGSLEFVNYLRERDSLPDIAVGEFAALPSAVRISGPTEITVFGRRSIVAAGVFPADRGSRVFPVLDDLYPGIQHMDNVLQAGLNNPNPTLHCLGVVMSASRIEYSHGDFYYYEEGMTPHVCQAIEAIDEERVAIGRAFGVEVMSLKDTYPAVGYGPTGDTFWSVIRGVASLHGIKGPTEIDSRYLTEDVPIGLTIYSQLGELVGANTTLMRSVIALTSALLGRDFAEDSRTLARCGLADMSRDEVLAYVATGAR